MAAAGGWVQVVSRVELNVGRGASNLEVHKSKLHWSYIHNCHSAAFLYRVGLKGLQGFEISRYCAAKGEKPVPICLSAIFRKIDKKSRNHAQAFQSYAVHV